MHTKLLNNHFTVWQRKFTSEVSISDSEYESEPIVLDFLEKTDIILSELAPSRRNSALPPKPSRQHQWLSVTISDYHYIFLKKSNKESAILTKRENMTSMQHQQQFISPFSVENIISKKSDKDTDEPLNHSTGSSSGYGK